MAFSLLALYATQNSMGGMCVAEECSNDIEAKRRYRQWGREDLIGSIFGMVAAGAVFIHFSDRNPQIPAFTPDQGNETLAHEVSGAVRTIQSIAAEHGLNLP